MSEKGLLEKLIVSPGEFDPERAAWVLDKALANNDGMKNYIPEMRSNASNKLHATPLGVETDRMGKPTLLANYLGLIGPVSALPMHYTGYAISERKRRSGSFFAFLEIFAAELRDLFIQASRKYNLAKQLQYDPDLSNSPAAQALLDLTGLATPLQRELTGLKENIAIFYCGHLSNQNRTAISLQCLIEDFLGFSVKVQQFHERRLHLDENEQTRLSSHGNPNAILGETALAGATCKERRSKIRLTIGPLTYAQYLSLMPDKKLLQELFSLIRLYIGPSYAFDVQLVLAKEEIPKSQLYTHQTVGRLGWDCWALDGEAKKDSFETVFDPDSLSMHT